MKNLIILTLFLFSFGLTAQDMDYTNRMIPEKSIGVHNQDFKLDGFYYSKRLQLMKENDTAKFISPLIFFQNGTVLNFDFIGNSSGTLKRSNKERKCLLRPSQDFDTILDFFKCYAEVVGERKISSVYSIDRNIIKIQYFGDDFFVEERGVVLNDSVFLINKRIDYKTKEVVDEEYIYQFQSSKKPDSTKMQLTSIIKEHFF